MSCEHATRLALNYFYHFDKFDLLEYRESFSGIAMLKLELVVVVVIDG